jgi:hypothetical protein
MKTFFEILGLKFAYSTNGIEIVEFDYLTAKETHLAGFPAPAQLWSRLQASPKESTRRSLSGIVWCCVPLCHACMIFSDASVSR